MHVLPQNKGGVNPLEDFMNLGKLEMSYKRVITVNITSIVAVACKKHQEEKHDKNNMVTSMEGKGTINNYSCCFPSHQVATGSSAMATASCATICGRKLPSCVFNVNSETS